MNKSQTIEVLNDIGLSENEARVYLACLGVGPTTAINIARMTEIKRPTVYTIIDSLKARGLMSIEVRGFKKKFVAERPEKLEEVLELKKSKFKKLLPELQALQNAQDDGGFIKYFEGMEGIKSIYESMIRDIKPKEDYSVIGNMDKLLPLDQKFFEDFFDRRAKLNINLRILVQRNKGGEWFKKYEKNMNAKVKYLPESTKLSTNLVMIPRRMLIHELTEPIKGIVIENKRTIDMQREMFEIMWDSI
ncbi:MAG: helix-turn-helix domain-containing protein [bacterium]